MAAETTSSATARHVIFAVFAAASTLPIFSSGYFLATTVILLRNGNNPSDGPHPRLNVDLAFAIFAFVVSLMGSAAVIWRVKHLAITCGTTLAIVVLLVLVVTEVLPSDGGEMDPLEEYPPWYRNFLLNDNDWGAFQRYSIQEKFCEKDTKGGTFIQDIDQLILRSGCCSPPEYCGYQEMNKTWTVPKSGRNHQEKDCMAWSNEVDKLCYNCNTCKAAYLNRYVMDWLWRALYMLVTGCIWIFCYAFMDTKAEKNCQGTAKAPACEP